MRLSDRAYIAFEIGPSVAGLESGLALTRAAAEAGADAIKYQILDAATLVGRDVPVTFGTLDGTMTRSMREILDRRALRNVEWYEMAQAARAHGLDVIATVDGAATLKLAVDLAADAIKVCSGDVTHLDWIREVAATGLPVMLDTGAAGLGEIERAVDAIGATPGAHPWIFVVHCPSGYPARAESINLRMLTTLHQAFGNDAIIGFSDHSPDADMDIAAIALGACYIEKTLCLDRSAPWPEHTMAVEPAEAATFVRRLREAESAMGAARRVLTAAEQAAKGNARRSAFALRDLAAGSGVPASAIEWRRPAAGGIEPSAWGQYEGIRLRRPVAEGEQITREDFA